MCLQSSALVLAIEGRFLLTLAETGDALVLTFGETGLTLTETYSQSAAACSLWMTWVSGQTDLSGWTSSPA
jgi:hypothetical protein